MNNNKKRKGLPIGHSEYNQPQNLMCSSHVINPAIFQGLMKIACKLLRIILYMDGQTDGHW